ncbi:hypothetical protein ACFPK1_08590 [Actinomycetospora rhizophila]|uniref:Uncharacterized protein n=1 Tax=Actinomycetospora rhizophila TaxID=1416876 RepID=A0ABV9ZD81_9PSEU
MTGRSRRADLVHAGHVVHGAALVLCPARVAARADGGADGRSEVAFIRVLGARHALQGLAGLTAPRWMSPTLGGAVDVLHAVSMVGLALLDRDHRRGASAGAAMALAFALADRWAAAGR